MPYASDNQSRSVLIMINPLSLFCMIIGFIAAFWFMHWGYWFVPQPLADIAETVIRAPTLTLALIPQILTNRFLSWTEIALYASVAWAIIGGVESVVWQCAMQNTGSQEPDCTHRKPYLNIAKGLISVPVITGIVLASWIITFILCFPFGTCVFRENLTSIMSPGLSVLSEETGIRFPSGTRLLYSDYSSFQGSYGFSAKLVVTRSAIRSLTKLLPVPRRASVYELKSVNAPQAHPWQKLDIDRNIMIIDIPEKGFGKNSTLINGRLYMYADGPEKSVIYITGYGQW